MITHEEIIYQLNLKKKAEKESFLTNFLNKFARKILCNIRIYNNEPF